MPAGNAGGASHSHRPSVYVTAGAAPDRTAVHPVRQRCQAGIEPCGGRSAGAGFVVAITGAIMTMPGLPKNPAAYGIDVDDNGVITGLF